MGRSTLDLFGNEIGADFADLSGFRAYVGGSPTNICVAAQRLGLKTALLTGMGEDYISRFLIKFLEREGVDTRGVLLKRGFHTNTVMVALQPPDDMQFVAYHANNADLEITIEDVLSAPLTGCRALLFNGMGLLKEPSRSATQFAAEYAHEHGAKVFMDLDYRVPMWANPQVYGITARVTLPLVDVVMGTEAEVCAAAGIESLGAAVEKLRRLVREVVIVKKGAAGSTVYTVSGAVHNIAPFQVEVVNFLGAGDAFAGGFIYGYLNGWDVAKAARFGSACGAMIVREHGTGNAMPTRDAVMQFIGSNGGF